MLLLLSSVIFSAEVASSIVIIDAGSSGSKMHMYSTEPFSFIRSFERTHVPMHEKNIQSISPLLKQLRTFLYNKKMDVTISVIATGGVRSLETQEINECLEGVDEYLKMTEFDFKPSRVLELGDEGRYLMKVLKDSGEKKEGYQNVSLIEMGGQTFNVSVKTSTANNTTITYSIGIDGWGSEQKSKELGN